MSNDPSAITNGIRDAEDAFEYIGQGVPAFETGINQDAEWKTQLTKACRYLEACRVLRREDGFSGAVVELCFGATERTLEGYVLWDTTDDISDFDDHVAIYNRVAARGLFEKETADALRQLYRANRTEHYYGALVPTEQKATAMYDLAEQVHEYVTDQIREGTVCIC